MKNRFSWKMTAVLFAAAALLVGLALADGDDGALTEADQALIEAGAEIYRLNCATCHAATGGGVPGVFPELNGNDNVENLSFIVGRIVNGMPPMPAFAHFDTEQITAVVSYIRTAWDNDFGVVSIEEVEEALGE